MSRCRVCGDELARGLHDRDPDIKVLYFTGYADQFFALRPLLRENETVLVKPVTMEAFSGRCGASHPAHRVIGARSSYIRTLGHDLPLIPVVAFPVGTALQPSRTVWINW